jgi:flagellar protein FlaJ
MKNIQVLVNKVLELVTEIETYSFYKDNLVRTLDRLFADYQQGKFQYFEYERATKQLLKGRSKEEWINYYNAYILSLMKRIEAYNSQIFYEAYSNNDYLKIGVKKAAPKPKPAPVVKPAAVEKPKPAVPVPVEAVAPKVEAAKPEMPGWVKPEEKAKPAELPVFEPVPAKPAGIVEVRPSFMDKVSLFFRRVFEKKPVEERIAEIKAKPVAEKHKAKLPEVAAKPIGKKESMFGVVWEKEKPMLPKEEEAPKKAVKGEGEIAFGRIFGWDYINNILNRSRKVEFSEKHQDIPLSTIQLETLRRKAQPEISAQIEKITATALTKEATRIRSIMERRKALKIYQPSFFGSLANVAIKRISLYLLDNFPDFFKDIYHALRLANIKVLSNTYVNMMVLGVLSGTLLGLFIFAFFFAATALPFIQVVFRTLMMAVLTGLAVFAGFYAYPYSKLKQRRRSINTNLPFAINHMAAVSSSGVAPVKMFRLISESKEYGEVSAEIEKIVNYVEIFGYDVLTALKAVAATSPSYQFKDFLEGMVSTTQTGGDIKSYFSQKAEDAMLNYKLDRQKYTETVSTYSDIYTGMLIAAPLFFVAALSLVSLLGGKVGGIGVNVIIIIGTYVVIPFLNVSFLAFLEMTQPEI